jgi:hypothetical protein
VDLISYHITRTSPSFGVVEATIGSGDKCGATYVDRVRDHVLQMESKPNPQ